MFHFIISPYYYYFLFITIIYLAIVIIMLITFRNSSILQLLIGSNFGIFIITTELALK